MYIIDNYSHEYKARRIFGLGQNPVTADKVVAFHHPKQSKKFVITIDTNAMTQQSCDWLHLFGGHRFDLLSTVRAKCTWVPSELCNTQKKQSQKPQCHEVPGWSVDWQTLYHSAAVVKLDCDSLLLV